MAETTVQTTFNKKISDVYADKYPELSGKLNELGITEVRQLLERFKANSKYLNETLEYEMKDNEIIFSMAQNAVDSDIKTENYGRLAVAAFITLCFLYYVFFLL
jgi:hypothetical protein